MQVLTNLTHCPQAHILTGSHSGSISSPTAQTYIDIKVGSTSKNPATNTDGWDTLRSDAIVIQDSTINNGDDYVFFKPNSTNIVVQSLQCNGSWHQRRLAGAVHRQRTTLLGQFLRLDNLAEEHDPSFLKWLDDDNNLIVTPISRSGPYMVVNRTALLIMGDDGAVESFCEGPISAYVVNVKPSQPSIPARLPSRVKEALCTAVISSLRQKRRL
ncbi:MAG: hypothetical protein LQ340_006850 [Diploschistes diacapsis]|nr:MAG: hypothetical protein LQ340_006850 [Diploschistes diacapsis]